MSNQELIKNFMVDCEVLKLTPGSMRKYEGTLKLFDQLVKKDFLKVDIKDLKIFLKHLNKKELVSKTILGHYAALSSFYNYLEFEDLVPKNLVKKFRRRYLINYKKNIEDTSHQRQIISADKMRELISIVLDPRDRCILILLAKTGVRVSELSKIDVESINWKNNSIHLEKNGKRSNCIVLFDEEAERALRRWLNMRKSTVGSDKGPLFTQYNNNSRLSGGGINWVIQKYARRIGVHKDGGGIEDTFTAHCFRHFFTTELRRSGMPREYIKFLRGDSLNQTIDLYNRFELEDVRESYMRCVPRLMV